MKVFLQLRLPEEIHRRLKEYVARRRVELGAVGRKFSLNDALIDLISEAWKGSGRKAS